MTNDPNTKVQAKHLLDEYYEQEKEKAEKAGETSTLKKPVLIAWNLHDDGIMVVVDGASGRKLEFEPDKKAAKADKTKAAKADNKEK